LDHFGLKTYRYTQFIESIDAILMGRNTFETVCAFDSDWPYQKPVYVLSNTLKKIPAGYASYASLLNGQALRIN
jgi:dihydrofolate reductase